VFRRIGVLAAGLLCLWSVSGCNALASVVPSPPVASGSVIPTSALEGAWHKPKGSGPDSHEYQTLTLKSDGTGSTSAGTYSIGAAGEFAGGDVKWAIHGRRLELRLGTANEQLTITRLGTMRFTAASTRTPEAMLAGTWTRGER
jgi:hypothetical protein